MKRSFRTAIVFLSAALLLTGSVLAFDPRGRTKKKKNATRSRSGSSQRVQPRTPSKSSQEVLIARYRAATLQHPGESFPVQRLTQLVMQRDGNLGKLIEEFKGLAASAGPSQYAAAVALAGIYREAGEIDRAKLAFRQAIALNSNAGGALLALANLEVSTGNQDEGIRLMVRALDSLRTDAEVEQTLRTLIELHLNREELSIAKGYHQRLVKRAKGSFFVRAELGRALFRRGDLKAAEAEFAEVARMAVGDPRTLGPALRDLGEAQLAQGKTAAALSSLNKAKALLLAGSGSRREVLELVVRAYRTANRLAELEELLSAESRRDASVLALLAEVYQEGGKLELATEAYRKALRGKGRALDLRLKLVELLQLQGKLDEALDEYKALVRGAPDNADVVLGLARALMQKGDKSQALKVLASAERQMSRNEYALSQLASFYESIGENARAQKLLGRLSKLPGSDPEHLVELGKQHFRAGDTEKAKETWSALVRRAPNEAEGRYRLGRVLLEHDLLEAALKELRGALELAPGQARAQKELAIALERAAASSSSRSKVEYQREARRIWERILREQGDKPKLAQEARKHIVSLWALAGMLQERIAPLEAALGAVKSDTHAGRLLAEIYMRERRYSDAERVLKKVTALDSSDVSSWRRLEQCLTFEKKLEEAIGVLAKLVRLEPAMARLHYQTMARRAQDLYQDERAIEFAMKAVMLNPEDAAGYAGIARMYQRQNDLDNAIRYYRRALTKEPHAAPVQLELARQLMRSKKPKEASRLLLSVVRRSSDEAMVLEASRLFIQLGEREASLLELERELLPLALRSGGRSTYRDLLLDLYARLILPLAERRGSPAAKESAAASEQLERLGRRAVKPLLDVLSAGQSGGKSIALDLLLQLSPDSAGPVLIAFAQGDQDLALRQKAMLAAAAARNVELLPKLMETLELDGELLIDESDPIAMATVWGVVQLLGREAARAKQRLLETQSPSVVALVLVSGFPVPDSQLASWLGEEEQTLEVRAAAAWRLGATPHGEEALVRAARSGEPLLAPMALLALARQGRGDVWTPLAHTLLSPKPELQQAAADAALVALGVPYVPRVEPFGLPPGHVQVELMLEGLLPRGSARPAETSEALKRLSSPLRQELRRLLETDSSRDGKISALAKLQTALIRSPELAGVGAPSQLGFGALSAPESSFEPPAREELKGVLASLAESVVPELLSLAESPDLEIRGRALRVLVTRAEPEAVALLRGLVVEPPSDDVFEFALAALELQPMAAHLDALLGLLKGASSWSTRRRAALAIAKVAAAGGANAAEAELVRALMTDEAAWVRQAAGQALVRLDTPSAWAALRRALREETEPKVRQQFTNWLTPTDASKLKDKL